MTYYEKHKAHCKKMARLYYLKNKDKKKAYKAARKEQIRKYNHEYYLRVTKIKRQNKRRLTKNS